MTRPPHLPDDGCDVPDDSLAAEHERDLAISAAALEMAKRHEAAVTAGFLWRLERRLAP